ncbi:MAG: 2Fe-2S iron-sulfur cluster-binding protein, partial [Planctomycetota bacterium]
ETTSIRVDGIEHEAPLGAPLIEFLGSIGKQIPRFCYHPGLSVQASCRQCQVESKGKGTRPGLLVACRERIVPEMEILTDSAPAREARQGVMEFLLKNHPLDCPICDKAGECLLQDTAYSTGQDQGRSLESRRRLPKRKSLGDRILLDNERCILCTRCVRFFEEVTKEPQLAVIDRGDRSVLTTFMDDPLRGNYQGNIVDLCPVGALTLKKFRFESRVWFLRETRTVCGLCSRGCNTIVETRGGKVVRVRPRYAPEVNGYWMCDKGRLDFDAFNMSEESGRLVEPMRAGAAGKLEACGSDESLDAMAESLVAGTTPILAILSPFATNEEGLAFHEAFRQIVRITGKEARIRFMAPRSCSLADDLLHTDADAPNARGLVEVAGLEPVEEREILEGLPENEVVLLAGYGLDRVVSEPFKIALLAAEALLYHGMSLGHFAFAKAALPAASSMEKNGHWTNVDGRTQFVRAALERPPWVMTDESFFEALAARVRSRAAARAGTAPEVPA